MRAAGRRIGKESQIHHLLQGCLYSADQAVQGTFSAWNKKSSEIWASVQLYEQPDKLPINTAVKAFIAASGSAASELQGAKEMPFQLSLLVKGVDLPQFPFEKLPVNQDTGEMQREEGHIPWHFACWLFSLHQEVEASGKGIFCWKQ